MDYDLIIIGAGWAGVTAARLARLNGLRTALIGQQDLGGTCLNRGCIPTKSLLESVHKTPSTDLDLAQAQARTRDLVLSLRQGLQSTLKGVDLFDGPASISDASSVALGEKILSAGAIIIASGSVPRPLGALPFDRLRVVSSDDMLGWNKAPRSLLVIGAGTLGMEFSDLFSAFGSAVTLLEVQPRILPSFDQDISRKMSAWFEKKGLCFHTQASLGSVEPDAFEKVAVCIGRQPLLEGLGLEKAGIVHSAGGIAVNGFLQTSIPGIYAVGDCNGLNMQAHAAALQARIAVEAIAGAPAPSLSSYCVPQAVFTLPQAAGVGLTEEQARASTAQVGVQSIGFMANGLARIRGEKDGLIKIVWDKQTDRLLGAWIFSGQAAEQISFFTLALQSGLTRAECRQSVAIHPSLSESLVEVLH